MHSELSSQPKGYFERHEDVYFKQIVKITSLTSINGIALRASYFVALRRERSKKPHTNAEVLILQEAVNIREFFLGRKFSQKLKGIPLSDSAVSRRISDTFEDLRCQLIVGLQHAKFAFQLDEFTDIANEA